MGPQVGLSPLLTPGVGSQGMAGASMAPTLQHYYPGPYYSKLHDTRGDGKGAPPSINGGKTLLHVADTSYFISLLPSAHVLLASLFVYKTRGTVSGQILGISYFLKNGGLHAFGCCFIADSQLTF